MPDEKKNKKKDEHKNSPLTREEFFSILKSAATPKPDREGPPDKGSSKTSG